jgi:hypothetical protein
LNGTIGDNDGSVDIVVRAILFFSPLLFCYIYILVVVDVGGWW